MCNSCMFKQSCAFSVVTELVCSYLGVGGREGDAVGESQNEGVNV